MWNMILGTPLIIWYWLCGHCHGNQESLLCGQHSLNNLCQACVFSPESLAEIAHQLDELELTFMAQNNEGGVK